MIRLSQILSLLLLFSCSQPEKPVQEKENQLRIVSLKGSYSESLAALGLGDQIVGVDVTSTYPDLFKDLPSVGHNANVSVEGIFALKPDIIVADPDDLRIETIDQLKSGTANLMLLKQEYSPEGTHEMITFFGQAFNADKKQAELQAHLDSCLAMITPLDTPSVLFIYARGTGSLLAGGPDTPVAQLIRLAGGKNAIEGFNGFKSLTPEALVAANPDVILMFDTGLASMEGISGLLKVPGMQQTRAGKENNIIPMDGLYLSGFGPRMGDAVLELNRRLVELNEKQNVAS